MSMFGGQFGQQQRVNPLDYGAQAGSPALISFFNAVYGWMAAGLALTAVVAWWVSTRLDVLKQVFSVHGMIMLFIAQIVLVMVISAAIQRISATVATVLFLAYAALNGLTLSFIFLAYTNSSVAGAFVASAVMFGAMSLWGMVTQRDLSGLGRFLFMALIGLIVASLLNIFLAHGAYYWIISYVGVAIFAGLTAYDTQKLRQIGYATAGNPAMAARLSISGALMLYLDFLNLFLFLLQIMGNRRQ
jgi:FtsH-binding integral membrane protein